jgi:hypothetical protein
MRSFRPAYAWRHAAAVLIGLVVVVPVAVGGVVQLAAVPAVAASVPSCAARQLSAAGMWGGATSFQAGGAYLTNWGARECSLQGYPTVILRSGGKQLDVATIKSHATLLPGAMKSSPEVILPPGQSGYAGVMLEWQNWCSAAHGPFGTSLRLPNGQHLSVVAQLEQDTLRVAPSCLDHTMPSKVLVDPVLARTPYTGSSLAGLVQSPLARIGGFSGVLPGTVSFSGDAGNVVNDLNWLAWNSATAVGVGSWGYDDCSPDCARGAVTEFPVKVTLSEPVAGAFTKIVEDQSGPHGHSYSFTLPNQFLNASSSPGPSSAAAQEAQTAAEAAAAAQAHAVAAANAARSAALCDPNALKITGGRQGEAFGTAEGTILLTNTSNILCSLNVPALTLVTQNGTPLTIQTSAPSSPVVPMALNPSASAEVITNWSNWCGSAPGPLEIAVTLPGSTKAVGSFNGPPNYNYVPTCQDHSRASVIQVVGAYLAVNN